MKAFVVVIAAFLCSAADAKQEPKSAQKPTSKASIETPAKQQWRPGATKPIQTPFLDDEGRDNAFEVPLFRDAKDIRESQTAPRPGQ